MSSLPGKTDHTRDHRCRLAKASLDEETESEVEADKEFVFVEGDRDDELAYEELPEDLREAGAIPVPLRDVRNAIGKDRERWKLSIDGEYQNLLETGAVIPERFVPRGKTAIPTKVVSNLKLPGKRSISKEEV